MNDIIPKDLNELLGAGDYLRLTILQVNKDLSSFTTERLEETEIDPDKIRTQLEKKKFFIKKKVKKEIFLKLLNNEKKYKNNIYNLRKL